MPLFVAGVLRHVRTTVDVWLQATSGYLRQLVALSPSASILKLRIPGYTTTMAILLNATIKVSTAN